MSSRIRFGRSNDSEMKAVPLNASVEFRFGSKAGVVRFSKEPHPSRGDSGLTCIANKFDSDLIYSFNGKRDAPQGVHGKMHMGPTDRPFAMIRGM